MLTYDERGLQTALNRLPPESRSVFAASAAERLASTWQRYFATIGRQDHADSCDAALDGVWAWLRVPFPTETVGRMLAEVMAVIPDEDEPGWSPLTSCAADALAALAYALRCLQSKDAQEATWAARCAYEAVDYFVSSQKDAEAGGEEVLRDRMVQAELERQARDIEELTSAGTGLSQGLLDRFRQRSVAEQAITVDP